MNPTNFQKTTLPGGLRVLTEHHPHVTSATLGVWIEAGSIHENAREQGLAHLLEHMVFKGTRRHSMAKIAAKMDVLGGGMNAFTEREWVCYHVKVLADQVAPALSLLCEFATEPILDADLLEIEKRVVIEEIKATEDEPDELIEELFISNLWAKSRWGRPIAGSPETVEKFGVEDLRGFMERHYSPCNCVVVAVGDVRHERIVKLAEKGLANLPGQNCKRPATPKTPIVSAHHNIKRDDSECAHLIIGTQAYAYNDPRRFAAWILDSTLTSGYSSRLFQEVREKRGLCYGIGGLSASYRAAGYWAVETSVSPVNARKTTDLIAREFRRVKQDGLKPIELKRAKQMARVNILLSEESSSAQMGRLARNEMYFGRQISPRETLAAIEAVSLQDVQSAAREMFDAALVNVAAIGPISESEDLAIEL